MRRTPASAWPAMFLTIAVLAMLAVAASALAQGRAMEGTDFARLLPPGGASIESYENSGYRLERDGEEIRVFVEVSPLESRAPFSMPRGHASEDPVEQLARALVLDTETQYEAASHILGWVARNVRYELDRSLDQSPSSVLERRSAYCTGLASLTVSLLRAVGIAAREVSGYVAGATPSGLSGYHRWVEIYYPDRGWVFSDPLSTHHYVPANYIRLARDEIDLARGHDAIVLERRDSVEAADVYPYAPTEIRARRNRRQQLAAAVTVMVAGRVHGEAILVGQGLRRSQSLQAGRSTFVGLMPGTYGLEVLLDGGTPMLRRLEVRGAVRASLFLPSPASGGGSGPGR